MKKVSSIILLFSVILFSLNSCDKDDDVTELTLLTLTSGNVDLYGATTAVDVLVDQPIVAVFSTNIDEATVAAAISLTKGGSDVAFTTSVDGATLTITVTGGLITGTNYSLGISAALKSTQGAIFGAATVTFTTIGVGIDTPPQSDNQVLYLQFDNSLVDVVGAHSIANSDVLYTTDRFGNTNGSGSFDGLGDIVEITYSDDIHNASMSFSCWVKIEAMPDPSRHLFGLGGTSGLFVEIGNGWIKPISLHLNEGTGESPAINWMDAINGGGGEPTDKLLYNYEGDIKALIENMWVQLVLTYDATTSLKTFYIDGVKMRQEKIKVASDTEWELTDLVIYEVEGLNKNFVIGASSSPSATHARDDWSLYNEEKTFAGLMDDFRIFNVALTESEVSELYSSED
jgi:hypothetical protein